jgi:hypothetical protein
MERTRQFGRNGNPNLERIDVVLVPIHEAIVHKINVLVPEIAERYQTLLAQELRYALELEDRAA